MYTYSFSHPDKIQEGISVVCALKNRLKNLKQALPTWLAHEEIAEIVIVDWSCSENNKEFLDSLNDDRIVYVRVEDQKEWVLTKAYNLGVTMTTYDKILKLDADYVLQEDFFQKNSLVSGTFVSGFWEQARDKNEISLSGLLYCYRHDFMQIKGYCEYIQTYGWDDDDLYRRLIKSGLEQVPADYDSVYHIPHDDSERTGNQKVTTNIHDQIKHNCNLALTKSWSGEYNEMTAFLIKEASNNHYVVCEDREHSFISEKGYSPEEGTPEYQTFIRRLYYSS